MTAATYEIIEWKGEEYHRFSTGTWMNASLEPVYDSTELENAYQAVHSSVRVSSEKYKTRLA